MSRFSLRSLQSTMLIHVCTGELCTLPLSLRTLLESLQGGYSDLTHQGLSQIVEPNYSLQLADGELSSTTGHNSTIAVMLKQWTTQWPTLARGKHNSGRHTAATIKDYQAGTKQCYYNPAVSEDKTILSAPLVCHSIALTSS